MKETLKKHKEHLEQPSEKAIGISTAVFVVFIAIAIATIIVSSFL